MCSFSNSVNQPPQFHLPPIEEVLNLLPKALTSSKPVVKSVVSADSPPVSGSSPVSPPGAPACGSSDSPASDSSTAFEGWNKCRIVIGRIESVDNHPSAEALFAIKLNVGQDDKLLSVCAGLRKYYSVSELLGRKVCAVLNLKPIKLKGILSEAMILAGDHIGMVRILDPHPESNVGESIMLEGQPSSSPIKQLSSTTWKLVVDFLKVSDQTATFHGKLLLTSLGPVRVPDLPDGAGIH